MLSIVAVSHEFTQLLVIISDKQSLEKVFLLLVTPESCQTRQPFKEGLPGKYQTGQIMWILWEWGSEGAPTTLGFFWWRQGCEFSWWFHGDCGLLLLKATENLEMRIGIGQEILAQVKMPQNLLLLLRLICFIWINSELLQAFGQFPVFRKSCFWSFLPMFNCF